MVLQRRATGTELSKNQAVIGQFVAGRFPRLESATDDRRPAFDGRRSAERFRFIVEAGCDTLPAASEGIPPTERFHPATGRAFVGKRITLLLSLVLPGAGHIHGHRHLHGWALAILWAACWHVILLGTFVIPKFFAPWMVPVSLAAAGAVWIWGMLDVLRR